jgi:hypothetical protein
MKPWFLSIATGAALTALTPVASLAQGVIDLPEDGVRIGEPQRHYVPNPRVWNEPRVVPPGYRETGTWNEPRVYVAPGYNEREVYLGTNCRTITIERDDGTMKRIRRCD